jgi:hypothetical protein
MMSAVIPGHKENIPLENNGEWSISWFSFHQRFHHAYGIAFWAVNPATFLEGFVMPDFYFTTFEK